jgi:uncharacterized protein (DUF1330 family)
MKTNYKIAIALVAGAAIGGAAIQGLHAQAKPKAYRIVESEVLDAAALAVFTPLNQAAEKAVGARTIAPPGTPVAFVGQGPTRVSIVEFESVEKYQAFRNSEAFKNITPQRDKAIKILRSYVIEGAN